MATPVGWPPAADLMLLTEYGQQSLFHFAQFMKINELGRKQIRSHGEWIFGLINADRSDALFLTELGRLVVD
ncbi:hypothetical protein, partial [Bradyrhizobium sp.]|uniref:hypothetical protein n=1 Tax=Bradyrhizobium sp. TaxID=376 RepID=UPI003C34B3C9